MDVDGGLAGGENDTREDTRQKGNARIGEVLPCDGAASIVAMMFVDCIWIIYGSSEARSSQGETSDRLFNSVRRVCIVINANILDGVVIGNGAKGSCRCERTVTVDIGDALAALSTAGRFWRRYQPPTTQALNQH